MKLRVYFDFVFFLQLLDVVKYFFNAEGAFVNNLGEIDVNKERAYDMAIESVGEATMTRD